MRFDTVPYSVDESLTRIAALKDVPDQFVKDPTIEGGKQAREAGVFVANRTVLCASFSDLEDRVEMAMLKAKRWRSLLSEICAVAANYRQGGILEIQDNDVFITLDTPYKVDVEAAIDMAAQIRSLVDIINFMFDGLSALEVGVGMDYGEVVLFKRKTYLDKSEALVANCKGGAKNRAGQLVKSTKGYVIITKSVRRNLSMVYRDFFTPMNANKDVFQGIIVNTQMNNWLAGQKEDPDRNDS